MRIEPEVSDVSLVILGKFNPAIFTPDWFGWRGFLSERVARAAALKIAQPRITAFQAEWLNLEVVQERFSISTTQLPYVRLSDLASRIFREELFHTPLNAVGINRQVHFLVRDFRERDRIVRTLAPVEPWGEWSHDLQPDARHGGMTSLTMTQVNLPDRPPGGYLGVTVQSSNRVGEGERGVFVQVNDHYTVEDPDGRTATEEIVNLLEKSFDESIRRAEKIIDHVMSLREE